MAIQPCLTDISIYGQWNSTGNRMRNTVVSWLDCENVLAFWGLEMVELEFDWLEYIKGDLCAGIEILHAVLRLSSQQRQL